MARANPTWKQESPRASSARLFAFLSFLFLASPCDAQIKSMSDGSLGGDLFFDGFPDELIEGIKSEDFAEAARKNWDAMSKALDKGSKEDFEKSVADAKNLEDAAGSRYQLRVKEWGDYEEQHQDAVDRRENGKINDDDVDVLKRYDELRTRVDQAREDRRKARQLLTLAEHTWKEWTDFWERKKAWEKEHPGKNMLAKRDKDWFKLGGDTPKKDDTKPEKPAQTGSQKSKSAAKKDGGSKNDTSIDPAAVEWSAGIAAAILGTQMGRHRDRSGQDGKKMHSGGMKETSMSRQKTTGSGATVKTGMGATTKSGTSRNSGGGTRMDTTVGAPTITFGRGMGF